MTDLGWRTVQKRGGSHVATAPFFWTDVEALGRLPSYHSCSPSRDTARADALRASARRTEGVGLEHGPFFFVPSRDTARSKCQDVAVALADNARHFLQRTNPAPTRKWNPMGIPLPPSLQQKFIMSHSQLRKNTWPCREKKRFSTYVIQHNLALRM